MVCPSTVKMLLLWGPLSKWAEYTEAVCGLCWSILALEAGFGAMIPLINKKEINKHINKKNLKSQMYLYGSEPSWRNLCKD